MDNEKKKPHLLERKSFTKLSFAVQLFLGLFTVFIGISIILRDNFWWSVFRIMIQALLVGSVIFFLFRAHTNRNKLDLLIAVGTGVFFGYSFINTEIFKGLFALYFGIWALFNAAVRGLELYLAFEHQQKGKMIFLLEFLVEFIMGLLLITSGARSAFIVNMQVGIYVILHGFTQVVGLMRINLRSGYALRMPAPVIATAFIPSILVKKVGESVKEDPSIVFDTIEPTMGDYVSIYIYIRDFGYNRMGHIDIGYNGAIYSYGCHDPLNRAPSQLFGDGVMIVGSEAEFVQYSIDEGATVIRFLCKLDKQQSKHIEKRIQQLLEPSYYFDYTMDNEKMNHSFLRYLMNAKVTVDYYKFKSGPFKTYNVFTTNCVLVADYIVQSTGMRLFHLDGIITPGTYYQYLHTNVKRPGSIVEKEYIYKKVGAKPKH